MKKTISMLLVVFTLILSACAVDYVTGKRTFNLVSEEQEIQMGKEADPSIVAQYGLYQDEKLSSYVNKIGQRIAQVSQRPNITYTFRIVDSPIVNAFALPGGWVYFTRGILAHFNSEAELAGVMGHEIGHVVARHGAEQMSKQQLAGLGLAVGSAISPEFEKFSQLAETGIGLLFLKFGREQESESDRLGVEYSTKLGYDAHQMADFFKTIARISESSGSSLPNFLSTHPNPIDREGTVNRLATEWQKKINYKPITTTKADYYKMIDGIVYGADPRQGFVENNIFKHPDMRFQFPVPDGWKLNNLPTSVQMASADDQVYIQFTMATVEGIDAAAEKFIQDNQITPIANRKTRINGLPAVFVDAEHVTQTQTIRSNTYFIQKDKYTFIFQGLTLSANYNANKADMTSVLTGFRELADRSALNKKPSRIRVKTVNSAGSFNNVMKSFGMKNDQLSELAILNGVEQNYMYKKGDLVKTISE